MCYYHDNPYSDGSLSRPWLFHSGPGPIGGEELEEGDAWQVSLGRSPRGTDQRNDGFHPVF